MRQRRIAGTESARISRGGVTTSLSQRAGAPPLQVQAEQCLWTHSARFIIPKVRFLGPPGLSWTFGHVCSDWSQVSTFPFSFSCSWRLTRFSVMSTQIPQGKAHLPYKATCSGFDPVPVQCAFCSSNSPGCALCPQPGVSQSSGLSSVSLFAFLPV